MKPTLLAAAIAALFISIGASAQGPAEPSASRGPFGEAANAGQPALVEVPRAEDDARRGKVELDPRRGKVEPDPRRGAKVDPDPRRADRATEDPRRSRAPVPPPSATSSTDLPAPRGVKGRDGLSVTPDKDTRANPASPQ